MFVIAVINKYTKISKTITLFHHVTVLLKSSSYQQKQVFQKTSRNLHTQDMCIHVHF